MGSNIGKYYRLPSATAFFAPQQLPSLRCRDSLLRAAATAVLAPLQQPSSRRRDCCRRAAASAVVAPPRLPSLRRRVCLPRATPCSKIWCAVGTASSSVQFARTPPVQYQNFIKNMCSGRWYYYVTKHDMHAVKIASLQNSNQSHNQRKCFGHA